jgi:hypothetical protein
MIGREWKRAGEDRQGPLLVLQFRSGPFRTPVGGISGVMLSRLVTCHECVELRLGVPGFGVSKRCKWLIVKPLEPPGPD